MGKGVGAERALWTGKILLCFPALIHDICPPFIISVMYVHFIYFLSTLCNVCPPYLITVRLLIDIIYQASTRRRRWRRTRVVSSLRRVKMAGSQGSTLLMLLA